MRFTEDGHPSSEMGSRCSFLLLLPSANTLIGRSRHQIFCDFGTSHGCATGAARASHRMARSDEPGVCNTVNVMHVITSITAYGHLSVIGRLCML